MNEIFKAIVRRCDGMLAPAVYEKIYQAALAGGTIVEVGTGLGAGTAALALGLRDGGRVGRVYTFDPMLGGPRRALRGVQKRVDTVRDNLAAFDVDHLVQIIPATLAEGLHVIPPSEDISVLMLDADGRIDRDILLLEKRIPAGAKIIIDDNVDLVRLSKAAGFNYRVDAKMRLTFLLLEWLRKEDFINTGELVGNTLFAERQSGGPPYRSPAPWRPTASWFSQMPVIRQAWR
ncbi:MULTISPECIES: class I SAM-dependent methyltransferase [Asticcacaulis]|uniref:class I SAM-dependent methyltransferase n=1 Tax=Asticcacaulis TaxID=76890 RepID=UPI001AE164AC|nr:class I SAM-dependent methyltransferase [Asticcacaulis sp. BE141]MBP2157570.1 putative O-methyltransferase YrrM [Asticcacaulis solisilvae]MDR6798615.1 putative O-methyltransferase YrrM [Asticcacaulis sp. BE141]